MTAFAAGHPFAERGDRLRVCADCHSPTWVPAKEADALWVVCAWCIRVGMREAVREAIGA